MQIGRKIYYELSTGNVLIDTGERQGSVLETTQDQDFESYVALSQRVPSTLGMLQFAFGELYNDFMSGNSYHVDLATGMVIFETTPPVEPLDVAKQRKTDELTTARNAALETFPSSALGTAHTYVSRAASIPNDMLLLTSEYSFVKGSDYDNQPIIWYTVEGGNVQHTAAQFIQVYLDARLNVQTLMIKCATLVAQTGACTTVDQVNAIVW